MLVDPARLLAALPHPAAASIDVEPLGLLPGSPEQVVVSQPGQPPSVRFVVRRSRNPERAANNIAVLEALERAGFTASPRLVGVVDEAAVETFPGGLPALVLESRHELLGAAMDLLAGLHSLPVREGLRWGMDPHEIIPGAGVPLFRLGFTSEERMAADPLLAAAQVALAASSLGFVQGSLTAGQLLLTETSAFFIDFESAGFGPQLLDVASLLVSLGLAPAARRDLALRYARARALDPTPTADLVDLAGLIWAFQWQLELPRRLIENMGDDPAVTNLRVLAGRIEESIRQPASEHPVALSLRTALWG
ncbi:MAG: phosphotransferase [Dehalococcoidia bacterium]